MKIKNLFRIFALSVILGCAPTITIKPTYQTNVDLIAESIRNIELPRGAVSSGQKVAIVNIESIEEIDLPVNYLVTDQLIQNIMRTGATVVERHPKIIAGIISESKDDYIHFQPSLNQIRETGFSTADRIIAFRVLECGLAYGLLGETEVMRNAYTSLHIRVEDAKSGQILWIGTLEGRASDQVPTDVVSKLEKRNLIFYKHGLPNQQLLK